MKIFTLLQNLLKSITGKSSRNLPFKSPKPKAQRQKPNRQSATLNAERVTPDPVLHSNKSVLLVNASVQNPMAQLNDASVSFEYKILPVQNAEVPASNETYSVEYKILPVQQKKTSVQTIKPVFMQNFFAIVKKIFSLSDHPTTLLENLNEGYHPGCHYGTAGTENISRTNQLHDVANPAASFALIPIAITPTAMNQLEKKPVKTITGRSGLVGILMLMSSLFFVSIAMGQRTASVSGNWSNTATWGGQAVPTSADAVTINSGINVTVDISPASCASLTFLTTSTGSTVTIGAGNTLNVTGAVTIPRGTGSNTLAVGAGILNAGSLAFTNGGGTQRHFLTISTGTATISGDVTQAGSSGSATITFTGAGLLQLGGAFLTPTTATFTASTGTVEYNGTTQSVSTFTYNNLILSNSGTKSLAAATTATGNLSVTGVTLNLADFALTVGSLSGSGNITNTSGGTTARTLTVGSDGSSPAAYSGVISNGTNTGGVALTKTGAGTLLLTGNNTYTGATTISAGTLTLNPASSPLTLSTPTILSGGTLSTVGIASSTAITNSSTLSITGGTSTISLGSNPHSISFANSSGATWSGTALTINNWAGSPGSSGTAGQIFFGATTGTLTAAQLAKISFTGFPGTPILLSTGELVPNGSPLLGITGTTNNGNSCVGTAAASKTYTITNTGAQADGVTVVSGDPQFVVSGLSSTSIPAGGNATYQVTFTPASAGPQTAIITVASTTTGSNSPTSNLTGSGGASGSWLGITDNNWFTASNWCGGLPTNTTDVTILSGTPNQPTIGTTGAVCRNITINSGATLTITGANTLGVSGNWTNAGTFTGATSTIDFNASVTQVLIQGASTFANVTHSGTALLQLSTNNFSTSATGLFNNSGAGTFDLNGLNATVGGLTGAGTITNSLAASAVTFTVNGSISPAAWTGEIQDGNGTTALTKSGTGALTLASTNTYSGATSLTAGTLNINNGSALGNSIFTITGGTIDNTLGSAVTLNNNVQNWNASFTFIGTNDLNLGAGAVTMSVSRQVTVNAGTLTVGGIISGAGSRLTKAGNGALTLTGANALTGGVTLTTGTLNINNAQALGTTAGTFIINGGTIDNTSGAAITTLDYPETWGGSFAFTGTNNLNLGTHLGTGTVAISAARTVTVNGGNLTVGSVISGAGRLTKAGAGTMTLTETNTSTGGTTISAGTLNINNSQALGTVAGTFIISGGSIDNTSGAALTTLSYPQTWSGDFTFKGTNDLNFGTGAIALSTATRQVTVTAGTLTEGGTISGAGFGITKLGPGILTLNGNSTYTGATTITAGELRFSPAANVTSNTQVVLNGGILGTTGIGAGVSTTNASTLNLIANSSINLDGATVHSVKFANSSAVVWTPGTLLTVNGWQGTAGFSGTAGKIFFGSSLGTLTAQQLSQITFTGFTSIPIILVGTGEIVPQGAAASLNVAGTLNNGSACVGVAAATQTYTITNTGPVDATGITVTSDNTEFVVSNISGTTALANNANTVTFQVTFTPTGAGAQSANITVFSAGSNSPVPVVTGTGLALPVSTFNYSPSAFCQAAITNPSPVTPNPSPTFTGGGVAGTFSASPAGLVFISTSTGQVDLRNSATGVYTVTNTVTGGNGCTSSSTASITINALPVATITYAQPAFCTTDLNTEPVTLVPSTGLTGSYSSIPGGLTLNGSTGAITPSTSTPGNYKVIFNYIGGPNLCPNTDTAFVTIAQTAAGTISYPGSPYCTNSGTINVTNGLTGTTTGAQFTALPSGLIIDPNTGAVTTLGSTAGSYTVTVAVPSIGGCATFTTSAPIAITDTPSAAISYSPSTICTNAGTASPTITGPTGGTFASSPAGLTISASTGVITTGTSTAGTYTVTYTTPAVNGCTSHVKTTVTIQASTAVPVLGTTTICTNTTTISITLTGEANGTPIQVLANGVTVVTLARTTSTNYTITAGTFHNGDVITITAQATGKCLSLPSNAVIVGIPPQPSAITGSNSVCPNTTGNAYSVTAVAGVTYAWTYTPAAGVTITGGTTATPTIAFSGTATSGTLTVTASNTCGAGGTQNLAINVNPGPPGAPGSITGLASVCTGLSQTYSISPVTNATNYTWTVPTGWTLNSGQGTTSINVTAGTVGQDGNITVVASNSCGNGANPASNAVTTAVLNAGTGIDNTGNSGGSVTWSNPGNITTAGTPFATAAVNSSFTPSHYLIGSNYGFAIPANASILGIAVSINRMANGTGILDNIVSLVKATNVTVGNSEASSTNWPNGTLGLANYGGANDTWGASFTPADINNAGFGVALAVTNSSAFANRTVTVDVMQISVTYATPQSLPVTVSSGPTITLGASPSLLCNGGTTANLPFTGTTGSPDLYSITYDAAAITAGFANVTNASLGSSPISLVVPGTLAGGVYNATITPSSSTGCIGTPVAFTITVPSALTTGTSEIDAHCFGSSDGSATVTPAGGNGSYTVAWTGPNSFTGSGTTISGIPAGTYNYSITDGNGCGPLTGSVVVGQAAQITASTSETDASCFGVSDGSASVTPANGIGSYTIIWNGPGVVNVSGSTISGLAAGTYNYSITDANGCGPITGSVLVGQPADFTVSAVVTDACSDGNGGSVTINVTGGSGGGFILFPFIGGGPDLTANTPGSIAPGTYSYLVFDGGCSKQVDFTVNQSAAITVTNKSQTTIACHGDIATVNITATGGSGPLVYIFDGVTNSTGIFTHAAGTGLSYTVTDVNDCAPATGTFDVVQPAAVTVSDISQTPIACNGGSATVTITATGGTGILSYTFDGITNTTGIFTHAAGTALAYSVTDANNCTPATGIFDVVQPDIINVSNVGQSTINCNGGNATVTITAAGGTAPLSYTFDGVTNASGNFTHAAGTGLAYSVTDANNCTAVTGTFDVVQPATITINDITQSTIDCNGGTATVTITATGGTGTLSYTFDGSTNTTGIFTHAAGTALAYSVTDANNCAPATGTFNVLQPDAITISNISQNTIACSGGTPTVTIVATGGTGTLSYTFDGVTNTTGIFPHAAGTGLAYSVTDANNCTPATGTFDVVQPAAVIVSNVAQTTILCNGGTATVTITATGGTGALSYTFDGVTNSSGIFTHATGTGLAYSVTDGNGCTPATGTFNVVEPAIITVSHIGQSTILCNGGSATVTITASGGTAPLSYTFDGVTNATGIFTHAAGTGLSYSVTDANNCSASTGTFDVVQPAIISITNVTQSTILCNGGSATVTITATGGTGILSYTFDGLTNTTGVFTHTAGTALAYSVTDANNCLAATGTFNVVEPAGITVTNVTQSPITCNGGTSTVTITGTGGTGTLSYTFDGITNTTGIFTHAAGNGLLYSVTDANNCTPATGTISIAQPAAITVSNIVQTAIDCNGGTATVTFTATGGTGTLSYTFDGATNTTGIFTHTAGSGLIYSVTDANNCTPATGTFNIVQPAIISVSNVAQSTIACNGGTATVTITASGGTGALSYTLDGVTNSTGIFTHAAGNGLLYSVTDSKNCTPVTGTFDVLQPAAISVTNVAQGTIICSGGTTTVTITATGGTGALSYTFDGVTNSTGIFTHAAGNGLAYSVTDANHCAAATGTVDITQSAVLSATLTASTNITCFGANNGTATITVTGGSPAYQYSIDGHTPVPGDNNNSKTFTGLFPGGHTVVITDNNGINGCSTSVTFTLTQPTQLAAIASAGTVSCNSSTTSLFVIATGGTAPYTYSLNGGTPQSGFVFTVGAGSYIVTVTDANSCSVNTASVGVANPTQMTISFTGITPSGCTSATGSFTITASGGAGSYTYSLNGGAFQPSGTFSNLAANTYLVTAKDGNGCTVSGNVTINGGTPPTLFNVTGGGTTCSGAGFPVGLSSAEAGVSYYLLLNNVSIIPPVTNALPGFAFSFGIQTAPGIYTVMAFNPTTGCQISMSGSATITSGTPPTAFLVTGGGNYCSGPGLPIGVANSQGGVTYQLVWNGSNLGSPVAGNGSAISFGNQTAVGTYAVVATNTITGCTNSMTGSVLITGGSLPTPFTVTSDPDNCTGLGVHIRLGASQLGVNYQLYLNGAIDGPVAPIPGGNGSPLDFGPQPSGTYTVVGTTTAGCIANMTGSVTVNSSTAPTAQIVTGGGSYCSGGLGLHVGLANSESGVTYQVFNGAIPSSGLFPGSTGSQIDFGLFQAGTYNVRATNANGCINTMTGNATISLTPTPTTFNLIAPNGLNDCTGTGVDIQLAGSETGVSYQLYMNGIAFGSLIPGTGSQIDLNKKPSGTYTIVGTSNTGGCIGNMSNGITVVSGAAPTPFNVTGGGNFCSGTGLPVGLSNSETGVNYVLVLNGISNVGFATGTTGNSITFGNQTANGSYTVTATNTVTNCTSQMSGNVMITAGTAPTVTVNSPSRCTGGAGVTITATPSPAGTYTYVWSVPGGVSDPGNVASFSASVAGTYSVTITNTIGCSGTGSGTLTVNPAPTVTVNSPSSCSGIAATITATPIPAGSYTYVWTVPGGAINPGNAASFSATVAGTYSVIITNDGGCSGSGSGTLSLNAPPTVTVSTPARCSNGAASTITANPSPAGVYTYVWTVPSGVTNPGNVASFTSTIAGAYSVMITNTGGCTANGASTLIVNTAPTVTVNSPSSCSGIAATITATPSPAGSYTYVWTVPGGASNPGNVASFTSAIAGTYSVIITNGNGCTGTGSGTLSLNTPPTVTVSTPARCSNGAASTITANPSPAGTYTYVWTVPAGVSNPGNVASFTSTIAGAYSVTITNTGGCTANGTSTLIVNTAPTVTVNSPTRNSGGPAATITATPSPAGSYSYAWTVPGGVSNPGSVASFSATVAGTYSVTITNGSGCTGNGSGVLTVVNAAAPTVTVNSASRCANGPGATITATPSPAGTYTYVWTVPSGASNPGNVASFTATVAGTYKVTITNASAQTATGSGILTVNPSVTIVTQPVSTQTCAGGTESFSVVATGATGYQWYRNSNLIIGATNAQYFTGIAARYDVRVFDACGGSVMSNFAFLTINGPVAITSQPQSQTICSGGTATFSVGANNANGFQWYRNNNPIPGGVNTSYTTGVAGNYKVVVTGGCGGPITSNVASLSFLPPPPVAGINGTGTICAGTTVRFTDATSGGTWSSSNTSVATVSATGFVRGTGAGTATIRYTITNGCTTNTATRNITVNDVPAVQDITGSSSVCPGSTIVLSDGTPNGDWSSSNTSIATVNNNGRVRGIRNGHVTISYTVQNSCGSKTVSTPIAVSCSSIQKNSLGATTTNGDELTLNVSVSPNPSQNFFTLIAQSSVLDAPITISIFDMQNRLVDKHTAGVGEAVRFGDRFAAGMYIVQVTQGGLQKTVKVVKN